jgi:hypothetical protein
MIEMDIPESEIERGLRLLERADEDVLSYLGIQAERLELAEKRAVDGKPVPAWSNDDAIKKVMSPQRASMDELSEYANRGLAYAQKLLALIGEQLRGVVCKGTAVREELDALSDDAKELLRAVATAIAVALLGFLPTLLATAAASVATTMAILLLKKRLELFCALGDKVIESGGA